MKPQRCFLTTRPVGGCCWLDGHGLVGLGWSVSLARGSLAAQIASNHLRYGADKPLVDRDASWFVIGAG